MLFPLAVAHAQEALALPQPPPESALPTAGALLALEPAARRQALQDLLTRPDAPYEQTVRVLAAQSVLSELDKAGRTDAAVVRGFLEAALSDDAALRDAAVAAARIGGLPPSAAPPVIVAAPAPPPPAPRASLEQLQKYQSQRLYKDRRQVVSGYVSGNRYGTTGSVSTAETWTVFQDSRPLTPRQFAVLVHDSDGIARLKRQNGNIALATLASLGLGVVGTVGGFSMLGDANENNDDAGLVLALGVGSVGWGVGIGLPLGMAKRRAWVASLYAPEDADRLIRGYNEQVRDDLGLTEADVYDIETGR